MWWRKSGDIEPELSRHEGNEDFLSKLPAQIHAVSRAIKRRGKIVEENDVKLSNQLPPNP